MTTPEQWASVDTSTRLRLAELVEATGVPASTIHHYRRLGLVPRPERTGSKRFSYDQRHVDALQAIRHLRERRGLALADIAAVLPAVLAGADGLDQGCVDARERLLEAAVTLFRTRTFGEVTVEAVAQAAGVAKGSAYRHFASKEEWSSFVHPPARSSRPSPAGVPVR